MARRPPAIPSRVTPRPSSPPDWGGRLYPQPLENDQRAREAVGKMNRRTLTIEILSLRVRTDQALLVTRFELVRVSRQGFEVANAVVARACPEKITKSERAQCGVAAGAAAGDGQPFPVYLTPLNQEASAVHAVVYVHDSPLAFEPLPIGAAIAGAAAIVHIEDGDTTAGPVLNPQVERS